MTPPSETRGADLAALRDGLTGLVAGLRAIQEGDLTVAVRPVAAPVQVRGEDRGVQALAVLINSMLDEARRALAAYDAMRAELREAASHERAREAVAVLAAAGSAAAEGAGATARIAALAAQASLLARDDVSAGEARRLAASAAEAVRQTEIAFSGVAGGAERGTVRA